MTACSFKLSEKNLLNYNWLFLEIIVPDDTVSNTTASILPLQRYDSCALLRESNNKYLEIIGSCNYAKSIIFIIPLLEQARSKNCSTSRYGINNISPAERGSGCMLWVPEYRRAYILAILCIKECASIRE